MKKDNDCHEEEPVDPSLYDYYLTTMITRRKPFSERKREQRTIWAWLRRMFGRP